MRDALNSDAGMPQAPWCAVYTRHQHERVVAGMLSAKGLDVFLPLYASHRHWKDREQVLQMPLFPCYVFVRDGQHRRLQIVTTPGVHSMVRNGEQVAVVRNEEIAAIRRSVESALPLEPHPYLDCGERVRVKRGALEGIEGILVRRKNQCRLVLSVDILTKAVAVELAAADVEPAGRQLPCSPAQLPFPNSHRISSW